MDEDPGPEAAADNGSGARTDEGAEGTGGDPLPDPTTVDPEQGGGDGRAEGTASEAQGADGEAEGDEHRDPLRFNNWMKRSATGAVMTGIAVGLQQALQLPRQEPAFVIEASGEPHDPNRPIDLHFDPDNPADTVAIIRRPKPKVAPEEPSSPA